MSKNLESEYKKIMNDQIPDLWDRIEAGLGEQEPAADTEFSAAVENTPAADKPAQERSSNIRPLPRRRSYKWIIGVAAAAACVCLVVPFALSTGSIGSSANMAATAEAYPEEAGAFEQLDAQPAAAAVNSAEESIAYAEAEAAAEEAESYEEEWAAEAEAEDTAYEYIPETAAAIAAEADSAEYNTPKAAPGTEDPPSSPTQSETVPAYDRAKKTARTETTEEAEPYEETEAAEAAEAEEADAAEAGESAESEALLSPAPGQILTGVRFRLSGIQDTATGMILAEILSCPDAPALENTTVILLKADPEETGVTAVPELPSEPGTYTGSLFVKAGEDGGLQYALLELGDS